MVKTNTTSRVGLASTARSIESPKVTDSSDLSRSQFGAAALGMSWQLAIVVLVPIFGGYKLDTRFDSLPLWTLMGLVVSLAGSVFVIRRALAAFGNFMPTTTTDSSTDKSTDDTRGKLS